MNEVRRNNHTATLLRFLTGASILVLSHDEIRRKSLRIATTTKSLFFFTYGSVSRSVIATFAASGELYIDDRMEVLCERQVRKENKECGGGRNSPLVHPLLPLRPSSPPATPVCASSCLASCSRTHIMVGHWNPTVVVAGGDWPPAD